jgi:hypothetical protein
MILVSRIFRKQLEKIGSIELEDIVREIEKHRMGLSNFIVLFHEDDMEMLKWYLLWKRVRLMVAFARERENYFPFLLLKKESRDGNNITKDDEEYLMRELDKHIECIKNWEFEKIDF